MTQILVKETKEVVVGVAHVCNRCGIQTAQIDGKLAEYLPQGWSHLRYVLPVTENGKITGPLEDDQEFDFCYTCTLEILTPRNGDHHISYNREFIVSGNWEHRKDKDVDIWVSNAHGPVVYVRNDHGIVAFVGKTEVTDELIDMAVGKINADN